MLVYNAAMVTLMRLTLSKILPEVQVPIVKLGWQSAE